MAEATAADYAWFKDHWLHEAFCITLVRGADGAEVLRRFGGEQGQLRTLTLGEAGELSGSFQAGYPQLVLAARSGGWTVAVEDNGWEGTRPEVLRALSRGTRAVSVYRNINALSLFSLAVDGALVVQFEPLFPGVRWGGQPDLLLPRMRAVGLDPDWPEPPHGELDTAALALAERATASTCRATRGRWSGPRRSPCCGRAAGVGRLEVDHRAGEGAGDAVHRLDPGDHELAQVVDVAGLGADDHVVGAGDVLGLLDALDLGDLLGDLGGLADLGLDEDVCRHHKQRPP
jgi:hypothetical protein